MRTFKNMMKMTLGAYIEMNLHNLPKTFSLAQLSPMCYTLEIVTNYPTPMSTIATTTPAEVLEISPENLEVANCYLQNQDIVKVAELMDLPVPLVTQILHNKQVKSYIDNVFMNLGFNNQFKMRDAMDAIIRKKFQDLEEADVGSSKDIIEILALSHKMSMEYLQKQIDLEKLQQQNIKSQVNVQINDAGDSTKYGQLIKQLVTLDAQ